MEKGATFNIDMILFEYFLKMMIILDYIILEWETDSEQSRIWSTVAAVPNKSWSKVDQNLKKCFSTSSLNYSSLN